MIATATQVHPPSLTLRNMASHKTNGRSRDGWLNLTREMETDEDEQFDVDLTILDFLVYKATDLVFEWKQSDDPYHSDLPNALVSMTADWRTVLSHRHQGRRLEPRAAFRSRLLQFALLFTHRMHHEETWTTEESLHELRESNKARGEYWQQRTQHPAALQQHDFDAQKDFPLSDGALHANRTQLAALLSMPLDQRRWVTDVAGTPALHCILPLLIELTAARVDLGDDWLPTSEWFDLVGQFMLQAVTEEYLRQGAHGSDTFNTIFAFGCPGVDRWAEEPETVMAMRRLFCDEDNRRQEHADWSHVKRHYINELLPQNSARSFLHSIERAQQLHPYTIFEDRVLSFLKSLHEGVDKPDLIQVEEGRISIDGNELSDTESREMIRRMGL